MTKAIIFDCFGVLVTENWIPFKKRYFGRSGELLDQATLLGRRLNVGDLNYDEFIGQVARMAGISEAQALREIDGEGSQANEKLLNYIAAELKPVYKIGLLSNVGDNWLREMFGARRLALFDELSLSYKTGVLKPNVRAYRLAADQLGVDPAACVFVDDKKRHCEGARKAGMQAILYEDFEQMKQDLERLLAADTKR